MADAAEANESSNETFNASNPTTIITPATPSINAALTPFASTPSVEFNEITLKEKVGHGSYGVVYKAIWRERPVAVKEFGASAEQKAIETEVKQLSRVSHPNIIALYGISTDRQSKYLIMEYAEGGSLHNFLHGIVKPVYSLAHAMSWARQCAEGVAYLHAMTPKPLIHRDLKPLNLLLTNKGRHLKICDFGTVADKSTRMTNNRGSAAWMAPEVFEGSKYTEKCDIFSWAIVLWEVLSRKQPFKEIDNTYSIMWKIHKGERPPLLHNCPERIEELMTSCWKTAPEERPSMKYVVGVMNDIVIAYPGADKPLEYIFINQRIITKDTCDTDEQYELLDSTQTLYTTDNNTTSTQVTPTNVALQQTNTNTSDVTTPTNAIDENDDAHGFFQPLRQHQMPDTFADNISVPNVPKAAIVSTNRWDAIPEVDEEDNDNIASNYLTPVGGGGIAVGSILDTTLSNGAPYINTNDSFNMTPSADAAKRYESIRDSMIQRASQPMSPLTLDMDTHFFEACKNGKTASTHSAKSDGRERLMVTDAKPIMMPPYTAANALSQTMTDMTNNNSNNNNNINNNNNNNSNSNHSPITNQVSQYQNQYQNQNQSNNNAGALQKFVSDEQDIDDDNDDGSAGSIPNGISAIDKVRSPDAVESQQDHFAGGATYQSDENDDTADQSLTDMLDPELQPEPPIPNNDESQAIYREHRRLAKDYLRVDTNLYYAQDFKEKLTLLLDCAEREQKQELLLKIKEKEELTSFYNGLKQQLEKLRSGEVTDIGHTAATAVGAPPETSPVGVNAGTSFTQRQISNASTNDASGSSTNHSNSSSLTGEVVADDGWVVIAPNSNT